MSMRILCRNIIKSTKPAMLQVKPIIRFESVLPALENTINSQDRVDLQSLYRKFPNAECFLSICKQYNLNENVLAETIEIHPKIANYEPSKISSNIQQLIDLGFEPNGIGEIIQYYPSILDYEPNEIINTFETWRDSHLFEKFLRKLFIEHSWLFSVSNLEVQARLHRIHYLMNHKINRITSLLLISPTIMIANWDEVEQKFAYVLKEMRYLEKEISRSTALVQPISRIKLRHLFVERVGVYIRPGLKDTAGMNPHINPPLSKIVDPDDDEFAINTAKVSPEEYQVFKKLMRSEDAENEEDLSYAVSKKRHSEFDNID